MPTFQSRSLSKLKASPAVSTFKSSTLSAFRLLSELLSGMVVPSLSIRTLLGTGAAPTVRSRANVVHVILAFLALCARFVVLGNHLKTVTDKHTGGDHIFKRTKQVFWVREVVWVRNICICTINRGTKDRDKLKFLLGWQFFTLNLVKALSGFKKTQVDFEFGL